MNSRKYQAINEWQRWSDELCWYVDFMEIDLLLVLLLLDTYFLSNTKVFERKIQILSWIL